MVIFFLFIFSLTFCIFMFWCVHNVLWWSYLLFILFPEYLGIVQKLKPTRPRLHWMNGCKTISDHRVSSFSARLAERTAAAVRRGCRGGQCEQWLERNDYRVQLRNFSVINHHFPLLKLLMVEVKDKVIVSPSPSSYIAIANCSSRCFAFTLLLYILIALIVCF